MPAFTDLTRTAENTPPWSRPSRDGRRFVAGVAWAVARTPCATNGRSRAERLTDRLLGGASPKAVVMVDLDDRGHPSQRRATTRSSISNSDATGGSQVLGAARRLSPSSWRSM